VSHEVIDLADDSLTLRKEPRRMAFSVIKPKKRSTWFSQELSVGMKWMCQRGRRASSRVREAVPYETT
jgi:hypothetical protein